MTRAYALIPELLGDTRAKFRDRVQGALKSLLEQKHLYQGIRINIEDLPDPKLLAKVRAYPSRSLSSPGGSRPATHEERQQMVRGQAYKEIFNAPWSIENRRTQSGRLPLPGASGPDVEAPRVLEIEGPDVKLHCGHCDNREAFNLLYSWEAPLGPPGSEGPRRIKRWTVQVFVLEYECQSCKNVPEIFLVRRDGLKITLAGRAPIEVVEVPRSIPEAVRQHFGGALLAHQSGQTLPGNFMLRTTVEQWARLSTKSEDRDAGKVIEQYAESLPDDFKSRFPSFRQLYADLSEDLHAAAGDAGLFEQACRDIAKHFEARELFELD